MAIPQQPIDRNVPVDDDLYGAWLGRSVAHVNLGVDASAAGDDMTVVNPAGVASERVGAHFTAAALGYMRRAEAAWRPDSFGVVSSWIKLDSVGVVHRIFTSADEAGDGDYWAFGVDAANHLDVTAVIGGVSRGVAGTTALVADRPYRVSVMSDGGTWALYVDEDRETVTPAGAGNDGSWLSDVPDRDNVCIAALRTNTILEYFDGSIRDVLYRGLTVDVPDDVVWKDLRGVPDDSLAFWTMGGEADLSRNELPITLWNDVTTGHYMEFHGGAAESLQTTAQVLTGGMTVSLWFNASAFASTVLFNNVEHLDRRLVIKTEAAGEMRAGYWQGAVYRPASGFGYEVGRWHHAYCTWDADETVRLWLDSTELLLGVDPSSGNALTMRLGASTGGTGEFTGLMRDARVWLEDKGEDFGQRLYETHRRAY